MVDGEHSERAGVPVSGIEPGRVEQPHCQVSHQSSLHILAGETNMLSGGRGRGRVGGGGGCVLNSVEQPHCQVSHQSSLHILAGETNMLSGGRGRGRVGGGGVVF